MTFVVNYHKENIINHLWDRLADCDLCPRNCGVNRLRGERGFCGGGTLAKVASFHPHRGEEFLLSGSQGSGTIFFSGCNMRCVYCQNYSISQRREGEELTEKELTRIMLYLQNRGCHNINLVTPSHFIPQIFRSLLKARENGLTIPVVYNTGGYDKKEVLEKIEGLVDIYLPDMKYAREESAYKYSEAQDYPRINREAVREMFRQVGEVEWGEEGVAKRGLIVRILIIPSLEDEARENLRFLAENVSQNVFISLMRQYRPCYKADLFPELSRSVDERTYREIVAYARELGLRNLILQ
ncbi:MAG TPA: radical SAM protein [Candidatus Atribacteria bacterium]|jgi:putative pyruvate formate lyase activating enzyme|nr:radical SAM protein [Atribacterota bacterium]HOA98905.1 radical SAM protein [Candidatus Atribacteria bacterium]MDI9608382.1 radical SAM protein [Atribacterota bacterium]HOQ50757.1 radical SAM protein [Candidatus Atribacteria bacterium]HPT63475.1 radical SAM protein [Candidatus Atribacteria bacterium]